MNIRLQNAPLTDEQLEQLNALLQGLEDWQVEWLSGYLSGFRAARSGSLPNLKSETPAAQDIKLTILYGSQTGNTEGVAEQLAQQANNNGIEASVVDMADYKPRQLKK